MSEKRELTEIEKFALYGVATVLVMAGILLGLILFVRFIRVLVFVAVLVFIVMCIGYIVRGTIDFFKKRLNH